jgi:hypothetical protein
MVVVVLLLLLLLLLLLEERLRCGQRDSISRRDFSARLEESVAPSKSQPFKQHQQPSCSRRFEDGGGTKEAAW